MTKFKIKFSFVLSLIICAFTLSSCLSINRNIKINKDGSGEETMKITFQKMFYEMVASMSALMDSTRRDGFLDSLYSDQLFLTQTKEKYDSIQGIKILEMYSEEGEDSSNSIVVKYSFDSVSKIGESLNTLKDDDNDGSIVSVSWNQEGDKITFNYFSEQSSSPDMSDSASAGMDTTLSYLFKEGNIKTIIEFPFEVISSNATSSNGNTLTWDYSMPEVIMGGKLNLNAVLKNE